jgi:hypothetical protein
MVTSVRLIGLGEAPVVGLLRQHYGNCRGVAVGARVGGVGVPAVLRRLAPLRAR